MPLQTTALFLAPALTDLFSLLRHRAIHRAAIKLPKSESVSNRVPLLCCKAYDKASYRDRYPKSITEKSDSRITRRTLRPLACMFVRTDQTFSPEGIGVRHTSTGSIHGQDLSITNAFATSRMCSSIVFMTFDHSAEAHTGGGEVTMICTENRCVPTRIVPISAPSDTSCWRVI